MTNSIRTLYPTEGVRTIYCDMDGVLVDFDKFVREQLSDKAQTDDSTMWAELQAIPNVYQKMKPTPYASALWNFIRSLDHCNRVILTAIPRVTSVPSAEADKKAWVAKYQHSVFMGDQPEVFIGPHSRDKWKHCQQKGDLLIDDRPDNCAQWETAGGVAVCHTGDINRTINQIIAWDCKWN